MPSVITVFESDTASRKPTYFPYRILSSSAVDGITDYRHRHFVTSLASRRFGGKEALQHVIHILIEKKGALNGVVATC